jgi:hypothetical protein
VSSEEEDDEPIAGTHESSSPSAGTELKNTLVKAGPEGFVVFSGFFKRCNTPQAFTSSLSPRSSSECPITGTI